MLAVVLAHAAAPVALVDALVAAVDRWCEAWRAPVQLMGEAWAAASGAAVAEPGAVSARFDVSAGALVVANPVVVGRALSWWAGRRRNAEAQDAEAAVAVHAAVALGDTNDHARDRTGVERSSDPNRYQWRRR